MEEHTPAPVVASYLVAQGILSKPNTNKPWPVFVNSMPELPDECVAIFDTDGTSGGRMMRSGKVVRFPGVQVRIRAKTYNNGVSIGVKIIRKIDSAIAANVVVDNLNGVGTENYKLNSIQRTTDLLPVGKEEGGSRELLTTNGLVTYGAIP